MKNSLHSFIFGLLIGGILASLLFVFLGSKSKTAGISIQLLNVAHSLPSTHPVHAGIVHMNEKLIEISNGQMALQIYPNGQLGSETQTIEKVQAGTLDIAKSSAAPIGNFFSLFKVFSLPYLFRDEDHYWNVLDGKTGQSLLSELTENDMGNPSGFRGLTYYDAGSRNFYAQKPILRPNDLIGLKVRVQNDPVAMDMVSALGGSPTPVAWGELYTALQQGVVDSAENNPPSFVSSRHFEICKEFTFDHHSRVPDVLIISSRTWDQLSDQKKEWLMEAAHQSSLFQREAWNQAVQEAIEEMRDAGVKIQEVDIEPFMKATESVRQKYALGGLKDLVAKIKSHP